MELNSRKVLGMKLKEILRTEIRRKGITLVALSRETKVPVQTINNWLSGSKPRDIEQLKRVSNFLNCSLDYLVFGSETKIFASEIVGFGRYDVYLKKINDDKDSK